MAVAAALALSTMLTSILAGLPAAAGLPSLPRGHAVVAADGTSLMQHRSKREVSSSVYAEAADAAGEAVDAGVSSSVSTGNGKAHVAGLVATTENDDGPKDASWFGSFDEAESTYDEDADGKNIAGSQNPSMPYLTGWEPNIVDPYAKTAVGPAFFHESPSGDSAWQTHFPAAEGGVASTDFNQPGEWTQSLGGGWSQEYRSVAEPRAGSSSKLPARWFDSSVDQYDGFGRDKLPAAGTGKRYAGLGWREESVNTTLSCKEPGCIANATLQAFEWVGSRAVHCKLSVFVHPTDFDSDFSGEEIEWISVNGVNVSERCRPGVSGCNASTAAMLHPCITEVPLDSLMPTTGTLNLAMKISDTVDECPYNGNLLSSVPIVTCMVSEKDPSPLYGGLVTNDPWADLAPASAVITIGAPAINATAAVANTTGLVPAPGQVTTIDYGALTLSAVAPLQCVQRGCEAATNVALNMAGTVKKCVLTVKVNQTDFDGAQSTEVIEFVNVSGTTIASDVKPGKNPCQLVAAGTPLTPEEMKFTVVDGQEVTTEIQAGELSIVMKISPLVDECASQGYLLDGLAEVNCTLEADATASVAS